MNTEPQPAQPRDLTPPNRIRVETAFARFPIHCLSKKGAVTIDLHRLNDAGTADFKWEVTYNSKHGQPGPLAYKVDTLVINRLLDQLGRPLPELIRIGSLSDVCRSLGTQDTGPNIANLKSAFLQNASAFINAKVRYKTKSGKEKWAEAGYTRYSVIFTGEALPDGKQADAVHIVLNPPYRELLNHVETRPLDYDYLKRLSPGPQRFYELLSFQIYGAIAGSRARAKMLYSDYCKYAPQVRYGDFDHVKKQMYKLHVPHRASGYIAKIDYQETTDPEGKADWEMFYTPGSKAFAEYQAFTNRQTHPTILSPDTPLNTHHPRRPTQANLDLTVPAPELLPEMTRRGIAESKARELLAQLKPGQEVKDQLEYVDFLIARDKKGKLENPPGLYIYYVRDNIAPPTEFRSSQQTKLYSDSRQLKNAETTRSAKLESDYEAYCNEECRKFAEALPSDEYKRLFDEQRSLICTVFRSMTSEQLDEIAKRAVIGNLWNSGHVKVDSLKVFARNQTLLT